MLAALLVALLSGSTPLPVELCSRPSPTFSQLEGVDLACLLGFGTWRPKNFSAEAGALLERLIETTPPDGPEFPELRLRQMIMLAERGRTEDWRQVIRAGALFPADRDQYRDWLLIFVAFARHHLGQPAAARRHLEELVERYPHSRMIAIARLLLAEGHLAEGRPKRAEPYLLELIRRDTVFSAYARLVLGLIAERRGQYRKAFSDYRVLLEDGVPGHSRARRPIQLALLARIQHLVAR